MGINSRAYIWETHSFKTKWEVWCQVSFYGANIFVFPQHSKGSWKKSKVFYLPFKERNMKVIVLEGIATAGRLEVLAEEWI